MQQNITNAPKLSTPHVLQNLFQQLEVEIHLAEEKKLIKKAGKPNIPFKNYTIKTNENIVNQRLQVI